eukprot:166503-Prymnesium_polylepis.1
MVGRAPPPSLTCGGAPNVPAPTEEHEYDRRPHSREDNFSSRLLERIRCELVHIVYAARTSTYPA